MNQTLDTNKNFVKDLTDSQIDDLMKEFDSYTIEDQSFYHSYDSSTFTRYLSSIYKKLELFKIFDQERKSITVHKETKKDLVEGPFFLN